MVEHLVGVGVLLVRGDAAGQHHHRHAVLPGVGDDIDRIGEAGADGDDQDGRRAVMVVDALAHEARAGLVPGEQDADAGAVERVHDRQHLAARNAEGMAAAGRRQPLCNQVRRMGHAAAPAPRFRAASLGGFRARRGARGASSCRHARPCIVMPGLVPGIHTAVRRKRWREIPGTSPGMTEEPVEGSVRGPAAG